MDLDAGPAWDESDLPTRGRVEVARVGDTTCGSVRPGDRLGPYRVVELLGEGGMARIFRAEGPAGEVALKVIPYQASADDPNRARFAREGAILEQLNHPNVVRLLGRGEEPASGTAWLAFELIPGVDLDQLLGRLPQRRLSPAEVVFVIERCARALTAAHAVRILHRDLKPGNVVVTPEGSVKLIDFGIALTEDASVRLTAAGHLVGTLPYVAPEVLREGWSMAADIYALGCLAYKLLSGVAPYRFPDVRVFVDTHTAGTPPRPLQIVAPDTPLEIVAVVERLMAPNPGDRPTAEQVGHELQAQGLVAETERVAAQWRAGRLGVAFVGPDDSVWNSLASDRALESAPTELAAIEPVTRGRSIGPYRVERALGRGAMGEIFLVRHEELDQRYALKLLAAEWVADENILARFEREMSALASVDGHPGIVRVHSAGRTEAGRPYFVMDYVEGATFRQAVQAGLTREAGLDLIEQVADALGFAHDRHVVHRDIKPDNIMLTAEGEARVTDFGLSKAVFATGRRLTLTGDVVGTPNYMAPEQVTPSKGEVGPWSDVFSLAAMAWELLLGAPPYSGQTSVEVYTRLVDASTSPSFRSGDASFDATVGAVLERALEPRTERRYANGGELRSALAEARAAFATEPESRRVPFGLVVAAAGSIVLGSIAVGFAALREPEPQPEPVAQGSASPRPSPPSGGAPPDAVAGAERARAATRAGDLEACRRALASLRGAERRALEWELWPWVGGARPSEEIVPLDGGWGAVAAGEQALAAGALGLAEVAFDRARADGASPAEVRLAGALGVARVELTLGRRTAGASWQRAWVFAQNSAPARERCLELARRLKRSGLALPSAAAEALRDAEPSAAPSRLLARARIEARAKRGPGARALLERLGLELGDSFCSAERAAVRRGAGLPVLAQALVLAEACAVGGDRESARRAAVALDRAELLVPTSPSLWLARAAVARVLGQVQAAQKAAARALALAPGDPLVFAAVAEGEFAARVEDRVRADVAIAAGAPDRALERKLAAACRSELRARQEALTRARGPRVPALRLALAEAHLTRANRLSRAGAGASEVEAERAAVKRLLAPLTEAAQVPAILAARSDLAAALGAGAPEALSRAERRLAAALASLTSAHRAAFVLLAQTGGEDAPRAAKVALAWGDLHGRALSALRQGERSSYDDERGRLLRAGLQLWPASPDLAFALACMAFEQGSIEAFGGGTPAVRRLASIVRRSPERVGIVLAGLLTREPSDEGLTTAWSELGPEEHVARALLAARGKSEPWHWRAALSAARAASDAPTQAGAHLLRAGLLTHTLKDERARRMLEHERVFAAACARGAAPLSAAALHASVSADAGLDRSLLDRALAAGFLANSATLDQDLLGRNQSEKVANAVKPLARHLAKLDLAQVRHTLGFTLLLERESIHPRLSLGLRLASAEWSGLAWTKEPLEATWNGMKTDAGALALKTEALLKHDVAAREFASKEHKALRPSGLAAAAEGCARERWSERPAPRRYRPERPPDKLKRLLSLRPAQPALERTWRRVEEDAWFVRNMLFAKVHRRTPDPLSNAGLSDWGVGAAAIAVPLAWNPQRALASSLVWRDPNEGLLAIERAISSAEAADRRGRLGYNFAFWHWRWHGVDRSYPLERRRTLLGQAVHLAARARKVCAVRQHGSLREAEAALSLDLAGLAAPASAARRRWVARAARLLGAVRQDQLDPSLTYARPLMAWRRARLAVAKGDTEGVVAAVRKATRHLEGFSAKQMRTDFAHYFKHDPLDAALRAVPEARSFIERVLVTKPQKKP